MYASLLFVFGAVLGSFVNVVAVRYHAEKSLITRDVISGRSRCPHCARTLRWYELVPIVSFILQVGRCRTCRKKISPQYFIVEILAGLIFVLVSYSFGIHSAFFLPQSSILSPLFVSAIWLAALMALLLVSLIDLRLFIIPDEANIFLALLGLLWIFLGAGHFSLTEGSMLGAHAAIFGLRSNIWVNHITAGLFGAVFFGALVVVTRGRGMGMGDVKLAAALGLLFGWPDIVLLAMLAFITGSFYGLFQILTGRTTLKGSVPFGPFLALGAALVFFCGAQIVQGYFNLFGL